MTYQATDAAGNVEATRTGWVNISNPFAQATNLVADAHSGWQQRARRGDHHRHRRPRADRRLLRHRRRPPCSKPRPTPPPSHRERRGQPRRRLLRHQRARLDSIHQNGYVNIDLTAPTTTADGLQVDDHSGWATTGQTVTLNALQTPCSGVAATYYTIDGGTRSSTRGPLLVSGEGSHPVTYWSVDAAGNAEAKHTGFVNIDTTAPATTPPTCRPTRTVRLAQREPDRQPRGKRRLGLRRYAATYYTLDGSAQQTYTSGPFTISAAGSHHLTYWSVDAAGNAEATDTGYVNIDETAPTTSPPACRPTAPPAGGPARSVSLSRQRRLVRRRRHLLHDRRRQPSRPTARRSPSRPRAATRSSTGRSTRPATPRPTTPAR